MRTRILFLWVNLGLASYTGFAQPPTASLSGRVLDARTGEPLPFASVYLNNSSKGALSDSQGVYHLMAVPLGHQEIVASFLGYQTLRLPLRLTDTHPRTVDLKVEPSDQALASVTVTARHNKTWERQLNTFTRELLGNRPQARQCRIQNPNVLSFVEEQGHLQAQANEPLLVENRALGYRLYYSLLHFDLYRGKMQFAGTSRFEEMPTTDPRQKVRWQKNRVAVYQGSIQHLLASLLAGTHEQAGYRVYQTPLTDEGADRALPFVRIQDRHYVDAQKASTLIKPGGLSFERQLSSDQPLEVYYDRVYAANSPYHDSPYAYSLLVLPKHSLDVNTNGWVARSNGLDVRGYMGNDRLATLLPADWSPPTSEMLLTNEVTAGRVGRADASLDSLTQQRKRQYELTPPLVYLHTDKSFYMTGDELWLSAYVLDAARQLPVVGHTALQVDLVSPSGRSVWHQWVAVTDGRAASNFRLADSLRTGQYRLRASTTRDPAVGNPAFECNLPIYTTSLQGSSTTSINRVIRPVNTTRMTPVSDSLDVQFLPEGGRWLAGVSSRLGIKVVAPDGRGRAIQGRIVDQNKGEIGRFTTNRLGMGQVSLTPQTGHRYQALIESTGSQSVVTLPAFEQEGWSLAVDALSDSSRLLVQVRAMGRYSQQPVYVTLQSREQLVYRQKWLLPQGEARFALSTASLPPGICRVTLWDTTRHARAERLIYLPDRTGDVQMRVTLAKPRYEPRQTVAIGFQLRDGEGNPIGATWSAAVTDADQVPMDTSRANLRTYLLLTGGLRGWIDSPLYYLEPEHARDLDNLLLTQGWRRLPAAQPVDSTGGWTLRGRVDDSQKHPMADQAVLVWLEQHGQRSLQRLSTDGQGVFQLAGLLLTDTVTVRARVLGAAGNRANISFEQPGSMVFPTSASLPYWQPIPNQLGTARARQLSWPAFYRDSTARQLAEVVVKAYKPRAERTPDQERSSLHKAPDHVMVVEPGISYVDMKSLLDHFPAFKLLGQRSYSSFGNTTPLFLIDGVAANWAVVNELSPAAVSRIEIMMSATNAGIYGARGGNGVVAIYTRKDTGFSQTMPTTVASTVVGFSSPREFYTPRYDGPLANSLVDQRDVLYWQAIGQTDGDGSGRCVFPLNDTTTRLRLTVQGLTNEGSPLTFSWELPVR